MGQKLTWLTWILGVSQGCNHLNVQPGEDIAHVLTWFLAAFRLWWIVELKSNLISDISSLLPNSICYMHVTKYIRVWGLHKDVDTRQQKKIRTLYTLLPQPSVPKLDEMLPMDREGEGEFLPGFQAVS